MRRAFTLLAVFLLLGQASHCGARSDSAGLAEEFEQANNASDHKDFKTAIIKYSDLIKKCTDSPRKEAQLYGLRGYCYLMQDDATLAQQDLSKAIDLDPYDGSNYKNRAALYAKLGKKELARADLNKVRQLALRRADPLTERRGAKYKEILAAHDARDLSKTVRLCREYLIEDAKNPAVLYMLGDGQFELGQFKEALVTFNNLIAIHENRYILNYRALTYAQLGQDQKAIDDFGKVLELLKQAPTGQFDKAVSQSSYSGKFLAPTAEIVYCTRAKLYLRTNQLQKTIEECSSAIKISPRSDEAHLLRAKAYTQLKKYEAARADYEFVLALNAHDELTAQRLAQLDFDFGRYELAVKSASRALNLDKDDWSTYLIRAAAYEKLNQPGLAADDRKAAARLKKAQ